MAQIKELTCINCPMGCSLQAKIENGKVVDVKGNTCIRGKMYAEKECTNPTRIVTSSVFVEDGKENCVSVKTEKDIPKNKIFECMNTLKGVKVNAPVKIGDIIVKNAANTGVNIIATKVVEKR